MIYSHSDIIADEPGHTGYKVNTKMIMNSIMQIYIKSKNGEKSIWILNSLILKNGCFDKKKWKGTY